MDATVTPSAVSGEVVLARYEEMRNAALEGFGATSAGLGAVVLIRQGMAAWLHAWSEYSDLGTERTTLVERDVIPRALAPDVVAVLAEMALQANTEAR